ncbi:MAG TPA: thioesterase family protein, partial [Microthrixaceae bacterium]|nr:thioesterase family protein [Microthrixaceae bacterium]
APIPARLARVTVELLRPVPLEPLRIETTVLRPGAKVATIDVTLKLATDDSVIAIARAQRIRQVELDFPDGAIDEVPEMPSEATEMAHWPGSAEITFHASAVEHRFQAGEFAAPGPAFDWMRLRVPVVPGESPTGWQRAVAIADFTNGISAVIPFDGKSMFINPDLTVHLWREPEGEWIGSDAVTRTSGSGVGLAETAMWDRSGRIGRGLQSLFLDCF